MTGTEIDTLLAFAEDHPELFESAAAPPTDSADDAASGGAGDSSGSDQGGDQPHD